MAIVSINDLLRQGWTGRKYFKQKIDKEKIKDKRDCHQVGLDLSKVTDMTLDKKHVLLEIFIANHDYNG